MRIRFLRSCCGEASEPQRTGAASEFWRLWGCPHGGLCSGQPHSPKHLDSQSKPRTSGDSVALKILPVICSGSKNTNDAESVRFRVWLPRTTQPLPEPTRCPCCPPLLAFAGDLHPLYPNPALVPAPAPSILSPPSYASPKASRPDPHLPIPPAPAPFLAASSASGLSLGGRDPWPVLIRGDWHFLTVQGKDIWSEQRALCRYYLLTAAASLIQLGD